jgi:hypothetical protein
MTGIGDVVLVYIEDKPAFFARIEDIETDVKPDWYHVKMLVLQIPLMVISWILRRVYIDGEEFRMGGRPVRLTRVVTPNDEPSEEEEDAAASPGKPPASAGESEEASPPPPPEGHAKAKVLSLAERRKKNHSS